jgi:hypothetical protein
MRITAALTVVAALAALPSPAFAQRFPFERTFPVDHPATLDVSTVRGTIEVLAGKPGVIEVEGAATVRVGWNVPANAVDLAKGVAASPPVEQAGTMVTLHAPTGRDAQRAVTVNYRVHVPPATVVRTRSESGATSVRGIRADVTARTQSATIAVGDLSGAVAITTGSGAVTATGIAGALTVTTASGAFEGKQLRSSLRVRTMSGGVDADLAGTGNVDVGTGSSAITLRGVRGSLAAKTQSGRVTIEGVPLRDWSATTGSSSVDLTLDAQAGFRLDAASRSGDVTVEDIAVAGATAKHAVSGQVGHGGATVRVRTGSGAIRVHATPPT